MISSWSSKSNKRGPPKYKMQVVYDLKSLAVVNVKDLGSAKLALKLLAFPDTRTFQCPTATNKVSKIIFFKLLCFLKTIVIITLIFLIN